MTDDIRERKSHYYNLQLPRNEALEVRDQLVATIKEIARQEGVSEILEESQFEVKVGKPALDPGTVIIVIVTYLGAKILDKVVDSHLDKVWDIWQQKILPKLKQKYGRNVLMDQDNKSN